jgi:hypothetical protein
MVDADSIASGQIFLFKVLLVLVDNCGHVRTARSINTSLWARRVKNACICLEWSEPGSVCLKSDSLVALAMIAVDGEN